MPKQVFRRHFPVQVQCNAIERELLEGLALATRAISPPPVISLLWKYNEKARSIVRHTAQRSSRACTRAWPGESAVREMSNKWAVLCNVCTLLVWQLPGRPQILSRQFVTLLQNWH